MIIPSIDLMDGQAVQLVGGKEKVLEAGDPIPLAEKFRLAGEIAVIDLDAAMGKGSNEEVIQRLLRIAPCRVGGGIRDLETAKKWLDAGAAKVILGTKAVPEILRELPQERVIAALDAVHGKIVVEGWQKDTEDTICARLKELNQYVGGFLVTFVEREGKMEGTNLDQVEEIVSLADSSRVTIAGGVTTCEDIAALDRLGADAQVGMALYTGHIKLPDTIVAPMTSDRPDGLWPTVVCDEQGVALGLAWSSRESIRKAVDSKRGVYHSRKRGIWEKGATSGATQELLRVNLDCDRDALRFVVKQHGAGFCHNNTYSCWGEAEGLNLLCRTLNERKQNAPEGSYTKRLFDEPGLLNKKLLEEVQELIEAKSPEEAVWETADVIYFTLTKLVGAGISLTQVEEELNRRALKITRRPGNAKTNT